MARNKQPPKPLFAVKHDFVDSLDAFLQQAIHFHQAVTSAMDLGQIQEPCATIVRERADAFAKALLTE